MYYSELQITSNFSFLRGASHPHELVEQAIAFGYRAIAITDRNTLAGIVRAYAAAKNTTLRIITGCRLDLFDGTSLLAYPTGKEAYANLCTLLTKGNLRTDKGNCVLYKEDVFTHAKGLKFIAIPPAYLNHQFDFEESFKQTLHQYHEAFGDDLFIAATRSYQSHDFKKLHRLQKLAKYLNTPLIATNNVYYHQPQRRELQDVLTCIREKTTIYKAGFLLNENAERHLKSIEEMHRLFRQFPDALYQTQILAEACQFDLSTLKYVYPQEITSQGRTPQEELTMLAWQGAKEMYGAEIPGFIQSNILKELEFIEKMHYASYFLTVYDIVRFAKTNTFCAREEVLQPTPQYVIVLALPLLILPNLIFFLKDSFQMRVTNLLILMLILNTKEEKK